MIPLSRDISGSSRVISGVGFAVDGDAYRNDSDRVAQYNQVLWSSFPVGHEYRRIAYISVIIESTHCFLYT